MTKLYSWHRLEPIWKEAGVLYYPHQIAAAERVLGEMNGCAILADEVGLGKTVEAGLICFELAYRGLVRKVLVLTPASLVQQWADEMAEKFRLAFTVNPRGVQWMEEDRIIASIDLAKRPENLAMLQVRPFDLVVVDEAHKLKNRSSQNYRLLTSLRRKYLLLITATPVQNDLMELFNLVSLIRPGLLGSRRDFQREYVIDRRTPRNPRELRRVLDQVMIRHKRQELDGVFPRRRVSLLPVALSRDEEELYGALTGLVRTEYRRRILNCSSVLPLLTLQREVCSSSFALRETLRRMQAGWNGGALAGVLRLADEVADNSKAVAVRDLVKQLNEKAIVFTEFRATQEHLARTLSERGFRVVKYHGGLDQDEREWCRRTFRDEGQVMISTECGGHGLNLQFCRNVINYDLPWNPMRVEQRIGRVHRLGQWRDVRIYNLYAMNTIEEHVLRLLHEKIDLFRRVVGELDLILKCLEREKSIESRILDIYLTAVDGSELKQRFEALGDALLAVKSTVGTQALS